MVKEFILCSAIDYNGVIISGRRYKDCYDVLEKLVILDEFSYPGRNKQGFLTSFNRFVNREAAFKIAKENNQIFHNMYNNVISGQLTSEDLYYNDEIDNI